MQASQSAVGAQHRGVQGDSLQAAGQASAPLAVAAAAAALEA